MNASNIRTGARLRSTSPRNPALAGTSFARTLRIITDDNLSITGEARLLATLQRLLALPALDVRATLMAASQSIVETLGCDKVDVFLLDEQKQTLRAVGTSDTPLGRRQRELGLDALALANGGRAVEVFKTGVTFVDGRADQDREELRGVVVELGVRSSLNVAFQVEGKRRGVLSAVSAQPEFFQAADVPFFEAVARWIGMLTHRAELAELARKTEAERARRMGAEQIITVLAHDLRNHLHPLSSRLHSMRLRLADKGVQAKDLEAALRSVQRITRLTNELLDVKRLDEGLFNLSLGAVDLALVARESACLVTASVEVHVAGHEELVVIADGDRVRQALENLIANAVKYSPPGKPVTVSVVTEGDPESGRALLEVTDSGPGIPPELLPRLFEPFASGPGSMGLGLGLYLAHEIARAHGGDLTVQSTPGAGTTFRLMLPLGSSPVSASR